MFLTFSTIELDHSSVGILFRIEQPVVSLTDTEDSPAHSGCGVYDSVDYCVKPWRVSASGR